MRIWRCGSRRFYATNPTSLQGDRTKLRNHELTRLDHINAPFAQKSRNSTDERTEFQRHGSPQHDETDEQDVLQALEGFSDSNSSSDEVMASSKVASYRRQKSEARKASAKAQKQRSLAGGPEIQWSPPRQLPLPPFLREQRKDASKFPYTSLLSRYLLDESNSIDSNLKRAPFSTAFALNPYARALATPTRQDTFSGAHLPRSCMIDLYFVRSEDGGSLMLSPVTLAAPLISNKKKAHRRSMSDEELEELKRQERSWLQPGSSASHVLNRHRVFEFIGRHNGRQVRLSAMSKRGFTLLEKENIREPIVWKKNMADVVLDTLRRVTMKKLGQLMRIRRNAEKNGVVAQIVGNSGLERLDHTDGVMCVLQMVGDDLPPGSQNASDAEDVRLPLLDQSSTQLPDTDESHAEAPAAVATLAVGTGPATHSCLPTVESHPESNLSVDPEYAEHHQVASQQAGSVHVGSSTYMSNQCGWTERDRSKLPFLQDIRPLPPPLRPAKVYYPTVGYRGRRVPIYDMKHLLGTEFYEELTNGLAVVFKDSRYVVMKRSLSSVEAQVWLLKLQAYAAASKEEYWDLRDT